MLIGVLSDSHGHAARTALAVSALVDAGAGLLIHLGDFETEEVLDELAGHPARIVFGNCDWDRAGLARHARHLGVTVDDPCGEIVAAGKRVVFTHGHVARHLLGAVASGADYLLHGHTHEVRDERIGATRVVNPGALFRAARYTAAVLDPAGDALRILELPRS